MVSVLNIMYHNVTEVQLVETTDHRLAFQFFRFPISDFKYQVSSFTFQVSSDRQWQWHRST